MYKTVITMKNLFFATFVFMTIACKSDKQKSEPTSPTIAKTETPKIVESKAKALVRKSIEAIGGKDAFYALKGVSYDYEYRAPQGKMTFIGHETYSFDQEKSHATFTEHSVLGKMGTITEGYNGTTSWITANGKLVNDEKANGFANFLRKTNYYWFTMFFKLLDEGLVYEDLGLEGGHHKIKVSFKENVGDAQDTYVLYINRETSRIDQFLFTVMDFGMKEPKLMSLEYETISGIQIPSKRKYIDANWKGEVIGKEYTITNWTNIKFGSQDQKLFEKPVE